MYEGAEYQADAILERLLDEVPADLDRREGSIIYDSLAAQSVVIASAYVELESNLMLTFVASSNGELLTMRTAERGVFRREAVAAVRLAQANVLLPLGTRLLIGTTYFVVTTAGTTAQITAEEKGTGGNIPGGAMTALDTVNGLSSVTLLDELVIPGQEEESDEDLKERYSVFIRRPRTSGNKYDYLTWAMEVPGVGGAQVQPLWAGKGTVKLFLIDSNNRPVTSGVAATVKQYINPVETPDGGTGEGKAPIGALLTVSPGTAVPINVSGSIFLAAGATIEQVRALFIPAFEKYLDSLAYATDGVGIVRYTAIAALLQGIPPIIDYANLTINGGTSNIQTAIGEVAIPGSVNLVATAN